MAGITPVKLFLCCYAVRTIGLGFLLFTAASASAQTKEEVVNAWKQQIMSLNSLQIDYEITIKPTNNAVEPFRANEPLTWKHKFALSGDKYYSYVVIPAPMKEIEAVALSYNGDYYQGLTHSEGKIRVGRWKKDRATQLPYLGGHPLTAQYKFAFLLNDQNTIKTLKDPETWKRLHKSIVEINPISRNGRNSLMATVEIPHSRRIYEVLVDDKTLLPYQWAVITSAGEVLEELEIKTFTPQKRQGSFFLFPSEIIVTK